MGLLKRQLCLDLASRKGPALAFLSQCKMK